MRSPKFKIKAVCSFSGYERHWLIMAVYSNKKLSKHGVLKSISLNSRANDVRSKWQYRLKFVKKTRVFHTLLNFRQNLSSKHARTSSECLPNGWFLILGLLPVQFSIFPVIVIFSQNCNYFRKFTVPSHDYNCSRK